MFEGVRSFDYDLVVLGAGPAGEKAANQAAFFGKKVAVVDPLPQPGGASLHTGTIPSKTLRESSLYFSGRRSRGLFGVNYIVKRDISVQDFMYRKDFVVRRQVERIQKTFDKHRVDLVRGKGSFVDAHTVRVVEGPGETARVRTLTADKVLIATGSRPWRPRHVPFDDPHVYDSDTILKMDELPRSLAIIGAGVIGCEYATVFAAMGLRTILLDGRADLLPFIDRELSSMLHEQMMALGLQTLLREEVASITRVGPDSLRLTLVSGEDFDVEAVLFAGGRESNTGELGLENIGLEPGPRGKINVDADFRTHVPNVFAAGDVIGFPALASTSMEQGRVAVCRAFGIGYKERVSSVLPYGIYTIPEISTVGESEQDCQKKGIAYAVGRGLYSGNARGQILGDEEGLIKLVFCPTTLKLLGVHIIGARATEMIHLGQAVLQFGGTIDYFIQTVFNYPTLSEAYKYAAYDGLGRVPAEIQKGGLKALENRLNQGLGEPV